MKEKVSFVARKTIKAERAYAVVKVCKPENAPLAVNTERRVLVTFRNSSLLLDEGEKKTMMNMLKRKELIHGSGQLTDTGRKLLEEGRLYRWHRALAKMIFIMDKPFKGKVIDIDLLNINDKLSGIAKERHPKELPEYEAIQNKWFKSIRTKEEFKLSFLLNRKTTPEIVPTDKVDIEVTITSENDSSQMVLTTSIDDQKYKLNEYIEFPLEENLKALFPEIHVRGFLAIPMNFNEALQEKEILKGFKTKKTVSGSIWFNSTKDDGWQIEVTLPVVPSSKADANLWVEELLKQELKTKGGYISQEGLMDIFNKIVEGSTIPEAISDWHFSIDKFTENLQRHETELYYQIKTTDDLWVDYETATSSPEELKRRIIVVDGSNVAWNKEDRRKGNKPLAKNIELIIEHLKQKGYSKIITYCDASLKYQVADRNKYDELLQADMLIEIPSRTIADYFVIDTANKYNCYVVSADKYRDWMEKLSIYGWKKPEIKDFLINGEEAIVYNLEVK